MKISRPITIRIIPPNIAALPENLVPNFFPIISPAMQTAKVTTEIISAHTMAIRKAYSAIANPTDRASMEVAMPCNKRYAVPVFCFSVSSLLRSEERRVGKEC